MDLRSEVTRRGRLAATHELLKAGATSHRLTRAVRSGELVRIRQGWYGLPDADPVLEAAVRVGGRATCVTAARELRLWVAATSVIHVRVKPHDARLRTPHDHRVRLRRSHPGVCVHWKPPGLGTRHRVDAREALIDMIGCQSPERVVAAADSAIRLGLVTRRWWTRLLQRYPRRLRRLLADVDPRSESIIESIVRFRLHRLGIVPELQVRIPRVGRVDMVIGRLVIELDGWDHHRTREAFEEDRRRDAELTRQGYRVLRFTYRAVTRDWSRVRDVIVDCIAAEPA